MPYQKISTPIFWVDILGWLKSKGMLTLHAGGSDFIHDKNELDVIGINPASTSTLSMGENASGDSDVIRITTADYLSNLMYEYQNFTMVLGHNLNDTGAGFVISEFGGGYNKLADGLGANVNNFNKTSYDETYLNGFSIMEGNNSLDCAEKDLYLQFDYHEGGSNIYNYQNIKIGSILYGNYYKMPNSPDLSLSMSYEYDGTKTIQTRGGSSLSNTFYTSQPFWGDLPAWEVERPTGSVRKNYPLARSGRKLYELSFSFLDDGDILGSNQSVSGGAWLSEGFEVASEEWGAQTGTFDDSDLDGSSEFNKNILTDNNFFSQVIHKTNGGQLPFIFQPDSEDKTSMIIAKMDANSLRLKQVANGVYNMKLKIREVW